MDFDNEINEFSQNAESADALIGQKEGESMSESPFDGIIGQCFYPYLYIYINSVDRWAILPPAAFTKHARF